MILVLVLGGAVWAIVANNNASGNPTALPPSPSSTPTASKTPSPTPSPSSTLIDIDKLGLVGMPCDEAMAKAKKAGVLAVSPDTSTPAPTSDQVGLVWQVSPTGQIPPTTTLTVRCYGDVTPIGAPANAPRIQGSTPVTAGAVLTLQWDTFTCPTGTGTISGYTVTINNATFQDGGNQQRSFTNGETSAKIVVANSPGQTLTASYVALCSGTGGQRPSGSSPQLTQTILPSPTGQPTP